ncbi:MAG: SDR family oxidoreductase [Verrucomicrobia bacterium]|nr:SDR family oxidoreductase [Kiritimatiellia bacterium]MCB1101368.1 SDR family oxidoreductase [Kiritimatiellia bacterium]MCP5488525.1 SDR family oxidoreductase [Verrucomicrobiota bacterium]
MKRLLITGASGFLGREMMRLYRADYVVVGVGHAHAGDLPVCDLREETEVASLLKDVRPDVVIHTAAYRDPDFCEGHPDEARRLNTEAVGHLVRHLAPEARLVQISTDYVFDGKTPPYRETDAPGPLNVYGRTKLDGEGLALTRANALVLRIPLLIGAGPSPRTSGFLTQILDAVLSGEAQSVDAVGVRFPTWIRDVAEASRKLLSEQVTGVVHLSSQEGQTRYQLMKTAGDVLGLPTDHLSPSMIPAPRVARRPEDSHLAIDRWRSLGGAVPFRFAATLAAVMSEWGGLEAYRHA